MLDRTHVAEQLARVAQHLDHLFSRAASGLASDAGIGLAGSIGLQPVGCLGEEPTVAADDGACGQVEFAPPGDVGGVAEGADHRDAGSLVGLREFVGEHGHLDAEHRGGDGRAEQRLVALVARMRDQGDAADDQFRSGGVDEHVGVVGRGPRRVESELVVRTGAFAVLEFGLCDRGLEGDVPQRRRLHGVRLSAREVPEERTLGRPPGGLADGRVRHRPVDREAETTEQRLERLLVDDQ